MTLEQIAALVQLAADVEEGKLSDPKQIGKALADLALDLLPVDELRAHLDASGQVAADVTADVLEVAKFRDEP